MLWSDLEDAQPRLAALGRRRLIEPGVLLAVTIRRDGTPRLSPVEPLILDGALWLGMMWHSTKAADLRRDPRVLVHGIVTARDGHDGEFKLRGTAQPQDDPAVQRHYAEAVSAALGWKPEPGRCDLFTIDIADVTFIRYDEATGDQFVTRWPPPREYVRRGDTPTSVGAPQPMTDLLIQG